VDPVLGGIVVEREQFLSAAGDLRDGLGELRAVALAKSLTARRALSLSSAFQIPARAFFAPG
jgi:hypothetical protein